jgi:hypothetical protein
MDIIDADTRALLAEFAHALAGHAKTRALLTGRLRALTVFENGKRPRPRGGTIVVAGVNGSTRYVVGPVSYPAAGWVQIGETAYPAGRIDVRGPVLFVARPIQRVDSRESSGG